MGNQILIAPERIERVRELLAEGLSQRAVARQSGVSRGTVNKVANGKRPDYAPKELIDPRDTLMPGERGLVTKRRCTVCAGLLEIIPCRRCKVVRLLQTSGVQVTGEDGPEEPLLLELKPEDYERYLRVHAKRVIAERAAKTIGPLYKRP